MRGSWREGGFAGCWDRGKEEEEKLWNAGFRTLQCDLRGRTVGSVPRLLLEFRVRSDKQVRGNVEVCVGRLTR